MTVRLAAAGRTDVGLVRRRNEDSFYVGELLFAVADGLGGHIAGDVASNTAISTLKLWDSVVAPANLPGVLGHAVSAANAALRHRIETEPGLAGMATTLVAMLCSGSAAALANVGDSRAYLLRDNVTSQITEDHTYAHLVADASEIPDLPGRLSRFLDGRGDGRSPDLTPRDLRPGDRYLLCSDGLSSYVPHEQIHNALTIPSDEAEATDRLIALAIDQGGPDNITVIVVDVRQA